ncbi:nitrate/nitrite two-component system sensor histidine kinase NarX [Marinobacter nanhaiticus D15-8W]|nr:nitrate/nitrite two-component system sensor histidine kinase NarX [Marinobacter nanhaiticus D15-8W]
MVVGAITLIALTNMLVSLTISTSIQGSATAINVAGSLRLHSFGLLSDMYEISRAQTAYTEAERLKVIEQFGDRLRSPDLTRTLPEDSAHPLRQQYQLILDHWANDIRPALALPPDQALNQGLRSQIEQFVAQINRLVTLLEERAEARVQVMNIVQMVSLVLSVLIILFLFVDIKRRVLDPLGRLVDIAGAVARKDFSQRAHLGGADELSRLGQAFDQMTSQLSLSYEQLESETQQKTAELERSNAALELLHRTSRNLFASHDLCNGAIPMLQELEQLLGVGPILLFLHDKNTPQPVQAVVTATRERPFYCRDHDCNACLVAPEQYDALPSEDNDGRRLLLPIRTSNQLLGTLEVWYPANEHLPESSRRLLETLCDQLATAIFLERQITEEQQLTLAEERAVIARELHDSLAQSLTYLKMQVARLSRLEVAGEQSAFHAEILNELSTGLNSAYRQLRELLTTFRLKLDTPDLATAVRQTVGEFAERLGTPVELEYELPARILSPNEEIHILQIIREALANAVKHAQATEVIVRVDFRSPQVRVAILDNGVGMPGGDQPLQHYGMIIMQDRARTLGGKLTVGNRATGGVEIMLSFVPKSRHVISSEVSAG